MFDAAKNFVIQNGIFVDIGNNAKIYARRLYSGSTNGTDFCKDELIPDNPRTSNYRQIRSGDMKLVDVIENRKAKYHDEYIVEVAGENQKRMARFYNGRNALTYLKKDFDNLSKLRHPRIAQIFGICDSRDNIGLIFHDDGVYRDYEKYADNMRPLERAAFYIKYIEEYRDATTYLFQHFGVESFLDNKISTQINAHKGDHMYRADFCINAYGRLNVTLSTYPWTEYKWVSCNYAGWDFLDRSSSLPLHHGVKLIQSAFNCDHSLPQSRSKKADLIDTWHSALLKLKSQTMVPGISNILLGQPLWMYVSDTIKGEETFQYAQSCYLETNHLQSHVAWKTGFAGLFQHNTVKIGKLTRFTLNNEAAASLNHHGSWSIFGELNKKCDQLYRSWLAGVTEFEYLFPILSKRPEWASAFGIVTKAEIEILIHVYPFKRRSTKSIPEETIYLFLSDPEVDQAEGMSAPPTAYWSLDKSGAKQTSKVVTSPGGFCIVIEEITMHPFITYWHIAFYEALHELYNVCGLNASDVSQLLGLQKFKQGNTIKLTSYMDLKDADFLEVCPQSKPYPEADGSRFLRLKRPNFSSLSWIGITVFEDYAAIRHTWYEHNQSRLNRSHQQIHGSDEDWIAIAEMDVDGNVGIVDGIESIQDWEDAT